MNNLKICWDSLSPILIQSYHTHAANIVQGMYKHLQHVKLDFAKYSRDNPFNYTHLDLKQIIKNLSVYSNKLNIEFDKKYILDQDYLNKLHFFL